MSDEPRSDKLPRSNPTPALASSLSSSLSSITTMSDEPSSDKLPRSNPTPALASSLSSSSKKKDLTVDGDVEANPGP
ncbi:hypothetical protein RCL1_007371 [Eukaryota sp. TZLM3-RCL]